MTNVPNPRTARDDMATAERDITANNEAALSAPDAALIDRLYRTHFMPLVRYVAKRYGPGPPEPEEVAQATFLKLTRQGGIEAIENPERFLHTIACNTVLDYHRRAGHRGAVDRDIARADAESLAELSPERVLLAKERLAIFEEAVKAMPAKRRRIFLMVRVEGLSRAEVAEKFGITQNAVNQQIVRALADCALAFEKDDRRSKNLK